MAAHSVDDCKNVFVTWQWLIGLILVIVTSIISLSYSAATKITKQEIDIKTLYTTDESLNYRVKSIEYTINKDMDTIKTLLRGK